jgi:hypothetical protein
MPGHHDHDHHHHEHQSDHTHGVVIDIFIAASNATEESQETEPQVLLYGVRVFSHLPGLTLSLTTPVSPPHQAIILPSAASHSDPLDLEPPPPRT